MSTPTTRAEISAFLGARHVPCPRCAYDLHGTTETACPECGTPLELEIAGPTPRDGAWFLASVGVAVAMGFDGVIFLVYSAVWSALLVGGAGREAGVIGSGFGMAALVCALVLRRLYTSHKWWAAQTPPQRWRGMWSILILTFVFHVVWGVVVFVVAV